MLRNHLVLEGEATMKNVAYDQSIDKTVMPQAETNTNRLESWLGLGDVVTRHWATRLRAVLIAGILLSGFVWGLGIAKEGLFFVLLLAIPGISLILTFLNEP